MLTADLLRVRKKDGKILPNYLRGPLAKRLTPIASAYLSVLSNGLGQSRDHIDTALDRVDVPARDRIPALGLRKVLEDSCEFAVQASLDPETVRREVFVAAAAAHRNLDVRARFDRNLVLADVAQRLGTTPADLDTSLYADLRGAEVLQRFSALTPDILLDRYNLALAQSILLRATQVTVHVSAESPVRYRKLFRAARFHSLLHVVQGDETAGYTLTLDGPFSLFDQVQRYGLRLALFLPAVLPCIAFLVRANVLWGSAKLPLLFEISPRDGLTYHGREPPHTAPELDAFCEAFQKLTSPWSVSQNERIFALPGEVVCVPDLVFKHQTTAEEVYLEVFGFWSRDAVFRRVDLIRKGFPARILLAVSKQLRVSQEVLTEDDIGEIHVFQNTLSPRAILRRLEAPHPQTTA